MLGGSDGALRSSTIVPPFFGGGAWPGTMFGCCGTTLAAPSSRNRMISEPHWITSACPTACFWTRTLLRCVPFALPRSSTT